jgi:hypothetical protein
MADAGRKQLEQVMHQLQEQLQINLLQQSHLMQAADKTGNLDNYVYCIKSKSCITTLMPNVCNAVVIF